jgi:hypothetical protein
MHYDLSSKIFPELSKQSFNRFGYAWIDLFKIRKSIDPCALRDYYDEAATKDCLNTSLWINYRYLKPAQKLHIALKTLVMSIAMPFSRRLF